MTISFYIGYLERAFWALKNKIIIIIIILIIIQNFIHRFKKIDYLQIQEYEILKYIPYVHSSCVRKRIVVK